MSRPLGILLSCSSLKFCCTRVADVSITGDCAADRHGFLQRRHGEFGVHVGGEAERDLDAVTLERVESRQLNVSEYTPGGTAGKRYDPFSLETCVCVPIIDGLVAVTVTPGNTALLESVTLP